MDKRIPQSTIFLNQTKHSIGVLFYVLNECSMHSLSTSLSCHVLKIILIVVYTNKDVHCACKVPAGSSNLGQAQRPKPPHLDRLCLLLSGPAFTPPQHAASRWPPLRGCFSRVACPASPHTRKRRPGVPLTGWRWGRGSAFPAFRKVGEYEWWLLVRAVSASGEVASGSIPRPLC